MLVFARLAGEQAAKESIKADDWYVIGFLFPLPSMIAAGIFLPDPEPTSLIGCSPEYIAAYTSAYKKTGKTIRRGKASIGCLSATATIALLIALDVL